VGLTFDLVNPLTLYNNVSATTLLVGLSDPKIIPKMTHNVLSGTLNPAITLPSCLMPVQQLYNSEDKIMLSYAYLNFVLCQLGYYCALIL